MYLPAPFGVCVYFSGFVASGLPGSEHQFLRLCLGPWVWSCESVHLHPGISTGVSVSPPIPCLLGSAHHSAPEQRGLEPHPGGTHSSSPTASSPTRPGLSAGSDEAQSSRVAWLSSSAQLPWTRVDLFSSSVAFSRASMSWDFQCTLGLRGDPP